MISKRGIHGGNKGMWRTIVAAGLICSSAAALANDKNDCLDGKDHDLRIKGCSALIERNAKDIVAYHNRGEAYGLKGDFDHAIADYTNAIVLDPNYAPAYNSRGRAYVSKGDYVRAVDDVTKAGELTRKVRARPAALKAATAKRTGLANPWLPVIDKAPVAQNQSASSNASRPEESSVAGKAPIDQKHSDNSWLGAWPTWMTR
jgi:tetratricopeptide (TPR) repeat protein